MELYILSKEDLRILSICKISDYQINLDEETNAKSTFTLIKTEGLVKDNFIVVNGLYKQFLFIIDDVQTEKGSNAVTVTALDISNIFDRKVIEKNTNTMRDKSIEEFIAKTISENFVNSDDTILNNDYIEVNWHTDTQGMVDTNTENGIYNFHTFLINCRQYKNIYTNFNVENIGKLQEIEGKHIKVNAKKRKGTINLQGETKQEETPTLLNPIEIQNITGNVEVKVTGKNLFDVNNAFNYGSIGSQTTINSDGTITTKCNFSSSRDIGTQLFLEKNTDYTISLFINSINTSGTRLVGAIEILEYDANDNFIGRLTNRSINDIGQINTFTFNSGDCEKWALTINGWYGSGYSGTLTYSNVQIEKGTEATSYEPYQEQTVYFPLAEGQKLMEGSYLSYDGIHNKRKQATIPSTVGGYNATEEWFYISTTNFKNINTKRGTLLSNYFAEYSYSDFRGSLKPEGMCFNGNTHIVFRIKGYTTAEEYKEFFAKNNIKLEYELIEEEIVPYTVEQKEAWEKLNNLILFDGINNINSTANISLNYYPQNPTGVKLILNIDIQKKEEPEVLIDTMLPEITDYNKIYEEDVTAKVTVLIRESGEEYNLYLKTDRTTTTDKNEANRAKGKIEVISVETADLAAEEALNVMKGNNYKHLVEFKIAKTSKLMDITKLHIGRPIRIRTEDDIYDSYISAITLSDENFVYFKSGSLRTTLLDKLKKNKDNVGNKLDVSGGNIKGNLNIEGDYQIVGNSVFNGKINNNNIKSVDIDANFKTAFKTQTKGDTNALGGYISTIRNNTANVEGAPQHGSGLAWGRADTHGYLYVGYSKYSDAFIGGGNEDELEWFREISTSTVLYDNTTGSSGTITLNDTADSYKYIEIYAQGFNSPVYTKVRGAGMAKLSEINFSVDYTLFQWFFCQYYLSGKTLTPQRYYYMSHRTDGNVYSENYNYFQVTKVVGYR